MLYDADLERALLGGIIVKNSEYDKAAAILKRGDFQLGAHQTIFHTLGYLIREGNDTDAILLANELKAQGKLETVGGTAYCCQLTEGILRSQSIEGHAKRVLELSQFRRLAALGEALAVEVGSEDVETVIERTRTRLEAILGESAEEGTEVSQYTIQALDRWQAERTHQKAGSIPYGIETLDQRTGGMYPGENTTVGGDPGHGKTALAIQAILANCQYGRPVFFVSLEMTREQVLRRLWSNLSGVGPWKLRHAIQATPEDGEAVRAAALQVMEWPLHVYDKSTVQLEHLAGMLRLAIRKHKVRLFILDFAQILSVGGRDMRERVSKASDQLTAIAKGEGVHLMLLSQMSRKSHSEWNRPPRMSDLRESGSLEQNAHCVVLIHRPWDEQNGRIMETPAAHEKPGCELIIAKQRQGGTSAFPVSFNPAKLTFEG